MAPKAKTVAKTAKTDAKTDAKTVAKTIAKTDAKTITKTDAKKDAKKGPKTSAQGKASKAVAQVASAVMSVPPMVSWMIVMTIALPASVALAIIAMRYDGLVKQRGSIQKPMENVRNQLADVFDIENIKQNSERAAEELLKMDSHIENANEDLEAGKMEYSSVFQAKTKSSHGWQLFGRSLYYTAKAEKSWYDAEYFCMSRGAHLASVLSDEEQNFITSQLQRPAWIGLTDINKKNAWEWIDGSKLIKQYWTNGESKVSEHQAEMEQYCTSVVPSVSGHNWNHANCHKRKGWMCKENLQEDEL